VIPCNFLTYGKTIFLFDSEEEACQGVTRGASLRKVAILLDLLETIISIWLLIGMTRREDADTCIINSGGFNNHLLYAAHFFSDHRERVGEFKMV